MYTNDLMTNITEQVDLRDREVRHLVEFLDELRISHPFFQLISAPFVPGSGFVHFLTDQLSMTLVAPLVLSAPIYICDKLNLSLQSVRVFFRTNRQTCTEWLSRIRAAVIIVALNCGRPEVAVRHSYKLLQELKDNNNTQVSVLQD